MFAINLQVKDKNYIDICRKVIYNATRRRCPLIAIFEQVLILITFCLTGYVLCKVKLLGSEHCKPLSVLLIYVFFPLMSFKTFSVQFTVGYLKTKGLMILVSIALIPVVAIIARVISKFLGGDKYQQDVNMYSMSVPNIGYMGYPLAEAVYGAGGMMDCMMFGLPMTMYINTYCYNMLTVGKGSKSILAQIFTPSMIGILAGCVVGIFGWKVPETLMDIAQMGNNCVAPVSMLLTGMALSEFSIKELLGNKKVYVVCAIRLIAVPLLVWGLVKLSGLQSALIPAVILYAMPCGMNTIVFPKLVDKDCRSGAAIVLVSTAISLITIPLCLHFLL